MSKLLCDSSRFLYSSNDSHLINWIPVRLIWCNWKIIYQSCPGPVISAVLSKWSDRFGNKPMCSFCLFVPSQVKWSEILKYPIIWKILSWHFEHSLLEKRVTSNDMIKHHKTQCFKLQLTFVENGWPLEKMKIYMLRSHQAIINVYYFIMYPVKKQSLLAIYLLIKWRVPEFEYPPVNRI